MSDAETIIDITTAVMAVHNITLLFLNNARAVANIPNNIGCTKM